MAEILNFYTELFGSEIVSLVLTIFLVALAAGFLISIVSYVLSGISLYKIGKRRGIKAYGLAWVPFGRAWMLGSIADQFDRRMKGRDSHYRTGLLIGDLVLSAAMIASEIYFIGTFISFMENAAFTEIVDPSAFSEIITAMGLMLAVMVPLYVFIVFYYIALYKVYKSCSPKSSAGLLVLAILVSFGGLQESIPLFCLRDKDDGFAVEKSAETEAEQKRLALYN